MAERYSLRVIWDDLALPDLACSFKLAIGPNKMLLAFCGVLAVCTLGYLMDRCTNSVMTGYQSPEASVLKTELDVYIKDTPKDTKAFVEDNVGQFPNQGVFSTLWVFASSRFHNAATQLHNQISRISYDMGAFPIYSNLTGQSLGGLHTDYWIEQLCNPVRFYDCISSAKNTDISTFIEIGPIRSYFH